MTDTDPNVIADLAIIDGPSHSRHGPQVSRYFAYCVGFASNLLLQPFEQK